MISVLLNKGKIIGLKHLDTLTNNWTGESVSEVTEVHVTDVEIKRDK